MFKQLKWSPKPAEDGDGSTYVELAMALKIIYGKYDRRGYDLELETRLMRAALHRYYAAQREPQLDGQGYNTKKIMG